jgi:hypothetical protein
LLSLESFDQRVYLLTREIQARRRWQMAEAIRIGIIGDFEPAYLSHFATNAALYEACA